MVLALLTAAHAAEPRAPDEAWHRQPIEEKANPHGTAYTVGRGTWSLGLVEQELGLLDNLDVGVVTPLWALGVPNVHGKVTAVRTRRLDVALDAGAYSTGLARFGVPDGRLTVTPVGFTASGVVSRRFSVHGGAGWTLANAHGALHADDLSAAVLAATGADIRRELRQALGDGGGVYAGAHLTLFQTRFAADWRLNRRDSLVLASNTWVWMSGLAAAGVGVDAGDAELQVGASARVKVPLGNTLPSLTTLSWRFDWPRVDLRIGVPLSLSNPFAWFQAFDLQLVLGPRQPR
ncbi:MAG: hypothetical protein R3F59_32620 [Myxococcota bacterium]